MPSLRNVLAVAIALGTVAAACAGLDTSGLAPDEVLEPDTGTLAAETGVATDTGGADTGDLADVDATAQADADALVQVDMGSDGFDARDSATTPDASDARDSSTTLDTSDARDAADAAEDVRDTADAGPPFCDRSDLDLLACYRLEFTEHAIQPWDDSSYDHHGTTTGATFVAGKTGQGASTTVGSLLLVPERSTFALTNKLTVEAWIFLRTIPTTGRAGVVDHNGRYGVFVMPGGIVRATAPTLLDTTALLTTGAWFHVAATYDGTTQIIYVNGVARMAASVAGVFGPGDGAGLTLGSNSPSGDEMDGIIDSVRIYRVARTALQICKAAGTC